MPKSKNSTRPSAESRAAGRAAAHPAHDAEFAPASPDSGIEGGRAPPSPRLRDHDDDIFDVAHNSMLRQAAEMPLSRRQLRGGLDWESAPTPLALTGPDQKQPPDHQQQRTCTSHDAELNHAAQVSQAVQQTWARANTLQEKAIDSAVRQAVDKERAEFDALKLSALKDQEQIMRIDAEKAVRRAWENAHVERKQAVAAAVKAHEEEIERTKREVQSVRDTMEADFAEERKTLKASVKAELEREHAESMKAAVQSAWASAGREKEAALAACAREADRAAEERMALERQQLQAEMRKTVQSSVESAAESVAGEREELRQLRLEVEELRVAARNAEATAARRQKEAVAAAVAAVERVGAKQTELAVARALATQQQPAAPAASEPVVTN